MIDPPEKEQGGGGLGEGEYVRWTPVLTHTHSHTHTHTHTHSLSHTHTHTNAHSLLLCPIYCCSDLLTAISNLSGSWKRGAGPRGKPAGLGPHGSEAFRLRGPHTGIPSPPRACNTSLHMPTIAEECRNNMAARAVKFVAEAYEE